MLLEKYNSSSNKFVVRQGGCKVKKEFIVKVFDEDLGFVDIHVKPGFYSYRTLSVFGGWKPTQITFSLKSEKYDIFEEGWLDVGCFFNGEYFELKNIWSVEAYGYGTSVKLIEDVDEEKDQQAGEGKDQRGFHEEPGSACSPVYKNGQHQGNCPYTSADSQDHSQIFYVSQQFQ